MSLRDEIIGFAALVRDYRFALYVHSVKKTAETQERCRVMGQQLDQVVTAIFADYDPDGFDCRPGKHLRQEIKI